MPFEEIPHSESQHTLSRNDEPHIIHLSPHQRTGHPPFEWDHRASIPDPSVGASLRKDQEQQSEKETVALPNPNRNTDGAEAGANGDGKDTPICDRWSVFLHFAERFEDHHGPNDILALCVLLVHPIE